MRNRLPDRRPSVTIDKGRFAITLGYHPHTGEISEVFADSPHRGTEYEHIITDVCTVISIALQFGVPVGAFSRSVGRVPAFHLGKPVEVAASPVGEILDSIAEGAA